MPRNSSRPTSSLPLPSFASARALGVAQITWPQALSPQGRMSTCTVFLGLRHTPSRGVAAAAGPASAAAQIRAVVRSLAGKGGLNRLGSPIWDPNIAAARRCGDWNLALLVRLWRDRLLR